MAASTPPKWDVAILNPPPPSMPGPRHKRCIATTATNTPCWNRTSSVFPADKDGPGLMGKELHTIVRKDIHDPERYIEPRTPGSKVPDIVSCLCNMHKEDADKYANMWIVQIYEEGQRREGQQG